MMAVRLRGKAGGLTRETIRSKFRSVNMTVGKPNTTPAQELRSFVHSCTLLSLSQLVEPGQSTADWEADRASLVQQRVCLAHYHPSFTDKFLERKLKSPGAKFILAHKTSPLGHDESEARLKDGSMVYAKGHYIILPSYSVVTECGACHGGSMTATDPALFKALTAQYQGKGKGHLSAGAAGTVLCEQCRLLRMNDKIMCVRRGLQREIVAALNVAPRPIMVSATKASTKMVNLLSKCVALGKDVSGEGHKLVTQSYGGRTRQKASIEGDKVAEAFDLVLKPLAYDVVTMSSFAVTAAMTGGGGKFDERDLVALEPADWHDQEVRIGPGLGFGSKLLLVKWMDGRDAAIIAKDVLGHLSDNVKAEADASIMAATKCALQERGGGAFGHLDTKGVLTPTMTANIKNHGGVYIPLKGYSMKFIYMSSIDKRKVGQRVKKGYIRESPHHVTNLRETCTLWTAAAVSAAQRCKSTRLVFVARAAALLHMSMAGAAAGIPVLDRSPGFYACLGRVLAGTDPFCDHKMLSLKDRALLFWWCLDSTDSSRGIAHWTANCPISGHFDKQHRPEVMFPVAKKDAAASRNFACTILPRRNVSYALRVDCDQALTWLQSVHLSDRSRGTSTAMTIVSV